MKESDHTKAGKGFPGSGDEAPPRAKVKFEVYGEEIIEKTVTMSGGCGRIYLPLDWLGKSVKIVRL